MIHNLKIYIYLHINRNVNGKICEKLNKKEQYTYNKLQNNNKQLTEIFIF